MLLSIGFNSQTKKKKKEFGEKIYRISIKYTDINGINTQITCTTMKLDKHNKNMSTKETPFQNIHRERIVDVVFICLYYFFCRLFV